MLIQTLFALYTIFVLHNLLQLNHFLLIFLFLCLLGSLPSSLSHIVEILYPVYSTIMNMMIFHHSTTIIQTHCHVYVMLYYSTYCLFILSTMSIIIIFIPIIMFLFSLINFVLFAFNVFSFLFEITRQTLDSSYSLILSIALDSACCAI